MEPGAALEGGGVGDREDNPLIFRVAGCRVDTIAEVMPAAEWTHAKVWDVLKAEIKDVDAWIQSIIAFAGLSNDYEGSSDEEEEGEEKEEENEWARKHGDGDESDGGEDDDDEEEDGENTDGQDEDDDEDDDDDDDGDDEDEDDEDIDNGDDAEQPDEGSEEDRVWRTVLRNRRDGIYQDNRRFGRPMKKNQRHLVSRIFRREPIDPHTLTRSQAEFVRNGPLLRMCEHPSSISFPEQVAYLARE
jgi:hypothetical protein